MNLTSTNLYISFPPLLSSSSNGSSVLYPTCWTHPSILGAYHFEPLCSRCHVLVLLPERTRNPHYLEGVDYSSPNRSIRPWPHRHLRKFWPAPQSKLLLILWVVCYIQLLGQCLPSISSPRWNLCWRVICCICRMHNHQLIPFPVHLVLLCDIQDYSEENYDQATRYQERRKVIITIILGYLIIAWQLIFFFEVSG